MESKLFTPQDLRRKIVKPALEVIGLWSPAAEDLMLGTALQESGLRYTHQLGGPARGLWQMEPATHDDIWLNFLRFRSTLRDKVLTLGSTVEELETDHAYACAMARIKYYRSPLPLPVYGDVDGYAHYWKQIYNTSGGDGTEKQFVANYKASNQSL